LFLGKTFALQTINIIALGGNYEKSLFMAVLILASVTTAFTQETADAAETAETSATPDAMPKIAGIPGEIKLPMGILTIRGMVLTGIEAKSLTQDEVTNLGGRNSVDGNWGVEVKNPTWDENRFDVHMDYSFLNYGAFMTLRWQSWAANNLDTDIMPDAHYVFVYAKFLNDKIKASLGKLPDDIYAIPESRLFKAERPWDMFNFTEDAKDNEHM
jgi:hypothetical protein